MKYYQLINGSWVRAHQYTLKDMRQINLYDIINGKMEQAGIGLY